MTRRKALNKQSTHSTILQRPNSTLPFTVKYYSLSFNLVLSLAVGIILNVVTVSQYRSYVRDRRGKDEEYYDKKTNKDDVQIQVVVVVSRPKVLTQKGK